MKQIPMIAIHGIAVALLLFWALSWGLSYLDLGAWSLTVALGIAAVKAALVILFFMEIVREATSVQITLISAAAMIGVLIFFMVADVRTRVPPPLGPPPLQANER